MAGKVTSEQILEAIKGYGTATNDRLSAIEAHLEKLNGTVRQNCTEIALLKQHGAEHDEQADKREEHIEELDTAVRAVQIDNARAVKTSAVIAAVITAIGGVIVGLLR